MEVPIAAKPRKSDWCSHCIPGRGCSIYDQRPDECRDFHCLWLIDERIPDYWKPSHSKMVLNPKLDTATGAEAKGYIAVLVDPAYPQRWRQEPWFSDLKKLARAGLQGLDGQKWSTVVFIGDQRIDFRP